MTLLGALGDCPVWTERCRPRLAPPAAVGQEPLRLRRAHLLPAAVHPPAVDGAGRVPDLLRAVRRHLPAQRRRRRRQGPAASREALPADRLRPPVPGRAGGGRRADRRRASSRRSACRCRFGLVAAAYAALLTAYSAWLKHLVILDVLMVALGFVLRAVAGAGPSAWTSPGWLLICTDPVRALPGAGQAATRVPDAPGAAAAHRPILAEYSEGFLDQMIAVVTASTVTAYALYTMSPETVAKFQTRLLPVTLPFVLYGSSGTSTCSTGASSAATRPTPPARPRAPGEYALWLAASSCSSTARRARRGLAGRARRPWRVGAATRCDVAGSSARSASRCRRRLRCSARARPRVRRRRAARRGRPSSSRPRRADRILDFDAATGRLTARPGCPSPKSSGVFLPRGWFPPVTPGTKFVTVGGCVASRRARQDHHRDGSFGRSSSLALLADGDGSSAGPTSSANCSSPPSAAWGSPADRRGDVPAAPGGVALDRARDRGRAGSGRDADGLRASSRDWPYTVGWIDCLARAPGSGAAC